MGGSWWWLVAMASSGCWSADPLIDGAFTPDQWSMLQAEFRLQAPPDPCFIANMPRPGCDTALELARQLFVDPALSSTKTVSCATCHDAAHEWIDIRSPDNVSLGAIGWTKRNAMALLNLGYKVVYAAPDQPNVFTWSGEYTRPGQVLDLAVKKAMASSVAEVAQVIRANPVYTNELTLAFHEDPGEDATIFGRLEQAFDGYLSEFPTTATPFDLYLQGQSSAISDSAKRGFAVFAGRGGCIECHSGPLFSDLQFHNTTVPQSGGHVPISDRGRADITGHDADAGKFLTAPLREVASTGPYMHDGVFESLGEVIAFYRSGGGFSSYPDTVDPRIQPLDITDDDAHDLEAFLRSLSQCDGTTCPASHPPADAGVVQHDAPGPPVDAPGPVFDGPNPFVDAPVPPICPMPLSACGAPPMCVDETMDPRNCGACGRTCLATQICYQGTCM